MTDMARLVGHIDSDHQSKVRRSRRARREPLELIAGFLSREFIKVQPFFAGTKGRRVRSPRRRSRTGGELGFRSTSLDSFLLNTVRFISSAEQV